jgi:hypothetical protein
MNYINISNNEKKIKILCHDGNKENQVQSTYLKEIVIIQKAS